MTTEEKVRAVLSSMTLLGESETVGEIDSLTVMDLVAKLEEACGKTVPTSAIRLEAFATVTTIASMLDSLE